MKSQITKSSLLLPFKKEVLPCLAILALLTSQCAPEPAAAADNPQRSGSPARALYSPANEKIIDGLLLTMTLEEKIGQMVQADIGSIRPDDLLHYKLGSILAGGLSAPDNNPGAIPQAWHDMVNAYKQAALAGQSKAHLPIPILFGIDAVHGHAKILGATIFPHNVGLGAAHDPGLIKLIGEATAQEVAATGIDWAFAPTVAVARDVRWGRAYESYSDDPELVAAYASSMVTGLQGTIGQPDFLAPGHVLSSAKHFIGDGSTASGRDQADARLSESALLDVHGAGYRAALAAGVGTVMASYSSWNGEKNHANRNLLTGLLKQRWGFDGFVIGDWNAQEEIPGCTKFSCPQMVNAGVDMVMAPDSWKQMYQNLLQQAEAGVISPQRVDDAVRRILRVKMLAGLIGATPGGSPSNDPGFGVLGSPAHRALAREAVRKSLVLLKNDRSLLPLQRHQHVLVVGAAADLIGTQCGGWTVDWQGRNHVNDEFPGATSIYQGIKAAVEGAGGTATFSADGSFTQRPDVVIMVYGEDPYAEFEGDLENLMLPHADDVTALLRQFAQKSIPVVSALLSGRPLWVNPQLNLSQAFVAAWLPGSEGEGLADLLFRRADGSLPDDFTGRLSFPWPATGMPVTYAPDGDVSDALFPRGYGLSTRQRSSVENLPDDPKLPAKWNTHETLYGAGHVIAPFSIYVADNLAEIRMTQSSEKSPDGVLITSQDGNTVRADWSGNGEATWRIGGRQTDLSIKEKAGLMLTLHYRLEHAPTAAMMMGMPCGPTCGAWVDITHALNASPGWQTLSVPLSCFAVRGTDLRNVETPLALKSSGKASIVIDQVSFTSAGRAYGCPTG